LRAVTEDGIEMVFRLEQLENVLASIVVIDEGKSTETKLMQFRNE